MTQFVKALRASSGERTGSADPENRVPLARALMESLVDAGVDHFFGIPGRHVQGLFHAMPGVGAQTIVTRHEQGAVFMADGFARVAGRPAGVVATAGPGAANLLTGVANAFADGIPLLCLTGAPPRHFGGRGTFQELGDDHTGVTPTIFGPLTRYNAQLSHAAQLGPTLRLALTALDAGGPVNVSLPADLLEAPVRPLGALSPVRPCAQPDAIALAEAAALLEAHPDALILAGHGALEARGALLALAERLQVPVLTTVHGRSAIDEDHPLALGPQGFSASNWAEQYMRQHRPAVVLAVGTSLREISTNVYHEVFAGRVALIHCTIDPQAIGRHYETALGVVADAEAFLAGLLPLVSQRAPNASLAAFKNRVPRYDEAAMADGPGRISPRRVVESLRAALGPDDMLFVDTGNAIPWSVRYFPVHRPGTYFASVHLAAMGWGLAAAIGAQFAAPQRRVVSLVGDGCFQIAGMEIATAVQYGQPVVWVVLNDARLNMVYQGSEHYYGNAVVGTRLSPIDCARVAEGLGAVGIRVEDPAELDAAIAQALACGRPAVVDVAIDPNLEPSMAGRFESLKRIEERGL